MSNSVRARMELDATGFQQGLSKAGASLNAFATGQLGSIKGMLAGAFTVGAIAKLATDAIDLGGKFDDLSKRTGVSAEELQRLDYVAKQNGSSIEALVGGLQKLAVARQKALEDPGGEQGKAFQDLGISIEEIARLSPEQLFYRIADAVKNQGAAVNNAASMSALLGRSFGELVPMMVEGGDGLRAMSDEATRLGVVLSTDTIKKLDALGDKLTSLKAQSVSWAATFAINVVSGFEALIEEISMGMLEISGLSNPDALAAHEAAMARIGSENLGLTPSKTKPNLSSEIGESTSEKNKRDKEAERAAKTAINDSVARGLALMKLDEESRRMDAEQEKQDQQDAIAQRDIKEGKGISVSAPISDNLARIGGYVGGAGSSALRVAERSEKIQEKMRDYLKKIAERDMTSQQIRDATPQ